MGPRKKVRDDVARFRVDAQTTFRGNEKLYFQYRSLDTAPGPQLFRAQPTGRMEAG